MTKVVLFFLVYSHVKSSTPQLHLIEHSSQFRRFPRLERRLSRWFLLGDNIIHAIPYAFRTPIAIEHLGNPIKGISGGHVIVAMTCQRVSRAKAYVEV